jgi:arsenical pump membrane protein
VATRWSDTGERCNDGHVYRVDNSRLTNELSGRADLPTSVESGTTSISIWALTCAGVVGLIVSTVAAPRDAGAAATQDWPPFVLVTGLLLIGMVANDDGLFAAAGERLARVARSGGVLFLGTVMLVGIVTALLNLDTSVAFLTPVLVYSARSRGGGEAPLLYGCLLLSNAGSLLLTGSNLTNLIVLGNTKITGVEFLSRMWAPALAALGVTAAVIAILERRELRAPGAAVRDVSPVVLGVGALAVIVATVFVVALRAPALPVVAVGAGAVGIRLAQRKSHLREALAIVGAPTLVGLFGVAVALGALGRAWSGPTTLLSHLDLWGSAAVAALSAVVVNNLPAASLLAARRPAHPLALLIGLNLGPNLFVTGSLAWVLWLRVARAAGAQPLLRRASRIGLVAVPLSMAAALGVLALTGSS